jgi:hypothetical protein
MIAGVQTILMYYFLVNVYVYCNTCKTFIESATETYAFMFSCFYNHLVKHNYA